MMVGSGPAVNVDPAVNVGQSDVMCTQLTDTCIQLTGACVQLTDISTANRHVYS